MKIYKQDEYILIPDYKYLVVGYIRKSGDIFYLCDDRCTFSNNMDDAYFARKDQTPNPLLRPMHDSEFFILNGISYDYLNENMVFIEVDPYRVIGYSDEKDDNGENISRVFGVVNTVNLAEMLSNKEKEYLKAKNKNNIDIVIEKYFSETDEWYNIETGMTYDESIIAADIVKAFNRFTSKLPKHHPQHQPDVANAINQIQRILQSRSCHRLYPDTYPIK